MKIIERHEPIIPIKRKTCDKCGSIFEFEKSECDVTDQLGVIHDGLGSYSIKCPVCGVRAYFNWT
jgi:RNA polymerase subunit RPABC4/transcription elongation factor Spt4